MGLEHQHACEAAHPVDVGEALGGLDLLRHVREAAARPEPNRGTR